VIKIVFPVRIMVCFLSVKQTASSPPLHALLLY
jgi:hypothetical protein